MRLTRSRPGLAWNPSLFKCEISEQVPSNEEPVLFFNVETARGAPGPEAGAVPPRGIIRNKGGWVGILVADPQQGRFF